MPNEFASNIVYVVFVVTMFILGPFLAFTGFMSFVCHPDSKERSEWPLAILICLGIWLGSSLSITGFVWYAKWVVSLLL